MKKILVIQTAFIGDVVLTTPFLSALASKWPGAEIHAVTTPHGAAILSDHPGIALHPFDKRRGRTAFRDVLGRLSAHDFDVVFSVHRSPRSLWLGRRVRARSRVAFTSLVARMLGYETVAYPPYDEAIHYSDKPMALLSAFGAVPATPRIVLTATAGDEKAVRAKASLRSDERYLVLSPFSVWGTKTWFSDRFARVGLEASLAHRLPVVITGGGGAAEYVVGETIARKIRDGGGRAIFLVGQTTMGELKALIRSAALVLTNDSAPVHIAAAFDVPTVVVFGPTVKKWGFFPRSTRSVVVERQGLECRPCSLHGPKRCPKRHFRCMDEIGVEDVTKAVDHLIHPLRHPGSADGTPDA